MWPFYDLELQFNSSKGIQKKNIWVEGMVDGLSWGRSKHGVAIWGSQFDRKRPHGAPFVAQPQKHLRVKKISTDLPEEDVVVLPYYYAEDQAIDYVATGAKKAVRGNDEYWSAYQVSACFGLSGVGAINVVGAEEIYYPVWIVKYKRKESERITMFSGIKKSVLDRIDMSGAVMRNEDIYDLLYR
jgi:hypothetical protein